MRIDMSKTVKVIGLLLLVAAAILAGLYFWRYSPTHVKVSQIERGMTDTEEAEAGPMEAAKYCQQFTMSPAAFEQYFLDAIPIFDFEIQDYAELPCFFKADVDGTEYRIYEGGLGRVKRGASIQWYGERNHVSVLKGPVVFPLGSDRKGAPFKQQ